MRGVGKRLLESEFRKSLELVELSMERKVGRKEQPDEVASEIVERDIT